MVWKKSSLLAGLILLGSLTACSTYQEAGMVETGGEEEILGVTFAVRRGSPARIRMEGTNRGSQEVLISLYTKPVTIGSVYQRRGTKTLGKANARITFEPREIYLAPGESGEVGFFLRNWYQAHKDFVILTELRVERGETQQYLQLKVDQNDLFTDPPQLYQENKLGRNAPGQPASRQSAQIRESFP